MSHKTITVKELNSRVEKLAETFYRDLNQFKEQFVNKDIVVSNVKTDGLSEKGELIKKFELFETNVTKSVEDLKKEIKLINQNLNKSSSNYDSYLQSANNNKILIHGMDEFKNKDLYNNVLKLIKDKMGIELSKSDIVNCYRLGKNNANKTPQVNKKRPIIMEFVHKWQRDNVFYAKKQLKGDNILITEMLTNSRRTIFTECYKLFKNQCWTRNGTIVILKDGVKTYVSSEEQLKKICG